MIYVPTISNYKPFWIQQATGSAQDILTTYGVIVKAHDYPSSLKVKDPYKNQWHDEHGDEEYIPSTGLMVEAFTFNLECAMFAKAVTEDTAIADLNAGIRAFQAALRSGALKTYDEYTGFGFQKVRVSEMQNVSSDNYDVKDGMTRVIFNVTLKVNDPVTHMVKSGNNIVDASTL